MFNPPLTCQSQTTNQMRLSAAIICESNTSQPVSSSIEVSFSTPASSVSLLLGKWMEAARNPIFLHFYIIVNPWYSQGQSSQLKSINM